MFTKNILKAILFWYMVEGHFIEKQFVKLYCMYHLPEKAGYGWPFANRLLRFLIIKNQ